MCLKPLTIRKFVKQLILTNNEKTPKPHITDLLLWVNGGLVMMKAFPCHDIIVGVVKWKKSGTIMLKRSIYSGTPLQRPPKMVAFQKGWPVMRGKINMICNRMVRGNGPHFATLARLSWPFQGVHCTIFPIKHLGVFVLCFVVVM